jgi:hypothetical protein
MKCHATVVYPNDPLWKCNDAPYETSSCCSNSNGVVHDCIMVTYLLGLNNQAKTSLMKDYLLLICKEQKKKLLSEQNESNILQLG